MADGDDGRDRGQSQSPPNHPVRVADPADAAALAALQSHLPRPSPGLLQFGLAAGTVLVTDAAADARPVGYLLYVAGDATHVAEVVVAPGHRRAGRARALLDALFDRVAGRVTVAVAPDNDAARACYRAAGFAVDARLPDFYDGDPAVRMARTVDGDGDGDGDGEGEGERGGGGEPGRGGQ